jgi:hypothetical protein
MAAKIGAMHASDVWLESAETNAKDRTALFGHPDSPNTNPVRLTVLNRFESGVMLKGVAGVCLACLLHEAKSGPFLLSHHLLSRHLFHSRIFGDERAFSERPL